MMGPGMGHGMTGPGTQGECGMMSSSGNCPMMPGQNPPPNQVPPPKR